MNGQGFNGGSWGRRPAASLLFALVLPVATAGCVVPLDDDEGGCPGDFRTLPNAYASGLEDRRFFLAFNCLELRSLDEFDFEVWLPGGDVLILEPPPGSFAGHHNQTYPYYAVPGESVARPGSAPANHTGPLWTIDLEDVIQDPLVHGPAGIGVAYDGDDDRGDPDVIPRGKYLVYISVRDTPWVDSWILCDLIDSPPRDDPWPESQQRPWACKDHGEFGSDRPPYDPADF